MFATGENGGGAQLWIQGTQGVCSLVAFGIANDYPHNFNDRLQSVFFSDAPPVGLPSQTILWSQLPQCPP